MMTTEYYLIKFRHDGRAEDVGWIGVVNGVVSVFSVRVHDHEPVVDKLAVSEGDYRETMYVVRDTLNAAYGKDAGECIRQIDLNTGGAVEVCGPMDPTDAAPLQRYR